MSDGLVIEEIKILLPIARHSNPTVSIDDLESDIKMIKSVINSPVDDHESVEAMKEIIRCKAIDIAIAAIRVANEET